VGISLVALQASTIKEQLPIIDAENRTPIKFKTFKLDFNNAETKIIIMTLMIAINMEKMKSM